MPRTSPTAPVPNHPSTHEHRTGGWDGALTSEYCGYMSGCTCKPFVIKSQRTAIAQEPDFTLTAVDIRGLLTASVPTILVLAGANNLLVLCRRRSGVKMSDCWSGSTAESPLGLHPLEITGTPRLRFLATGWESYTLCMPMLIAKSILVWRFCHIHPSPLVPACIFWASASFGFPQRPVWSSDSHLCGQYFSLPFPWPSAGPVLTEDIDCCRNVANDARR